MNNRTIDILNNARAAMSEHGWTSGNYVRLSAGEIQGCCILGAVCLGASPAAKPIVEDPWSVYDWARALSMEHTALVVEALFSALPDSFKGTGDVGYRVKKEALAEYSDTVGPGLSLQLFDNALAHCRESMRGASVNPYNPITLDTDLHYASGPDGPHSVTVRELASRAAGYLADMLLDCDAGNMPDNTIDELPYLAWEAATSAEHGDSIPIWNLVHPGTHEPYEWMGEVLDEVENIAIDALLSGAVS